MWNCWKKKTIIILFMLILSGISAADEIEFAWDYGETQIDGFRIYEGFVNPDFTTDYTLAVGEISPTLRTISYNNPGKPEVVQKYCYYIRAYHGSAESNDSNIICLKIDNTPLEKPSSVKFLRENDQVILEWEPVERAKYYIVYSESGDEYKEIVKTENTQVQIPDEQNTIVVVAFKNDKIYSPNSDLISITAPGIIPAPENFCFGSTITN